MQARVQVWNILQDIFRGPSTDQDGRQRLRRNAHRNTGCEQRAYPAVDSGQSEYYNAGLWNRWANYIHRVFGSPFMVKTVQSYPNHHSFKLLYQTAKYLYISVLFYWLTGKTFFTNKFNNYSTDFKFFNMTLRYLLPEK